MDKTKRQAIRNGKSLSMEERHELIQEYLTGNYTKRELWKKYTGQPKEHGQILRWMEEYGYLSSRKTINGKNRSVINPLALVLMNKEEDLNPEELQKRIKELEKQLESALLKAEGYELMIQIAEKELKIPIRKKPDTK